MPLPADTDATTPKYLRDKYAIVGVGETTYTRGSGQNHARARHLGDAQRHADAGLKASDDRRHAVLFRQQFDVRRRSSPATSASG